MISNKKYTIRYGDTLSLLAEKFMNFCPTLNRINHSIVEDIIFNNNPSAFGKNKHQLLAGRDLDLSFICRCRENTISIDANGKELKFSHEDKLAYSLDPQAFWNEFTRINRELAEYLQEISKVESWAKLPDSIVLNDKPKTNFYTLLGSIVQKSLGSRKIIHIRTVITEFLKTVGINLSDIDTSRLIKQLADTWRLNYRSENDNIYIPSSVVDKADISPFLSLYCGQTLSISQQQELEHGRYTLTSYDKIILSINPDIFWEKLYQYDDNDKEINKTAYKAFGLKYDLSTFEDAVFAATETGLKRIDINYHHSISYRNISREAFHKVKVIALYANFQGADITQLKISSTGRSREEQANQMVAYLILPNSRMYPSTREKLAFDRENYHNGSISLTKFKEIAFEKALEDVNKNPHFYGHLKENLEKQGNNVFDIGPGKSNLSPSQINIFNTAMDEARKSGYISRNSKLYGEGASENSEDGEKAFHFVID